jgi:phosphocarrier protein HPr
MITLKTVVTHQVGLHARPATLFVRLANKYSADIRIRNLNGSSEWTNAKSILSLLIAGVKQNDQIEIQAIGLDEIQAVESLVELIRSDFKISSG